MKKAEEVAAAVRKMGRKAVVIGADVAVRDQVDAMVAETVEHLGRLDIAVCNAARSHRAPFLDLTVEQVRETLNVTLWGVFHVAQASARQMVAREEGGAILFISSVHAFLPVPESVPYNTAKAGAFQLTRVCAAEWASRGVRVNSISPGHTLTPMTAHAEDEMKRTWLANTQMGRLGTPADYRGAAVFLASDASAYMTRHDLLIDGGYTLW